MVEVGSEPRSTLPTLLPHPLFPLRVPDVPPAFFLFFGSATKKSSLLGGLIPGYLGGTLFEPESWSGAPGRLVALGGLSDFLPTSVPEGTIAVKILRDVRDLRAAVVGCSSSGRKCLE